MKKILLSLAACAFFFASCGDSETLEGVDQNNELLSFSTSIGKSTRAAEFMNDSWKQGDKFMIHAYQNKPTGWSSYFTQELEKGESSWILNGDQRYRLPYASKFISIFPREVEGDFNDTGADFTNTYPSIKVNIDNYDGYYPDLIASVSNVEALKNKVDMKFRHLLSQINIGVEEYKDAKITIKNIKFKHVPSEGTYIFNEPEGEYGYWIPADNKTKDEIVYPFSKENSFTTTGLAANGSYIFGDGGNYAAGDNYKYVYSDGTAYAKSHLPEKLDNSMMVLPANFGANNTVIEFTYSATDIDGNPIGNNTDVVGTINPKALKVDWKQNYRYLYMIKFNFDGNKLKFNVSVDNWENYNQAGDDDGMIDTDYDTSTAIPFHIYPNDKYLTIDNINKVATYTIPTDLLPKETEQLYTIALIFDDTTSGATSKFSDCNKINVVIPQLPINFPMIKIDASLINSTNRKMAFSINNSAYTGTVSFVDYYSSGKAINIGAFDFNMPNGSAIVSNNYVINGDMNAANGLINLDGAVTGNIYVKGNGTVNIKSNDATTRAAASDKYKTYATSSITNNAVSKWYGFGFSVNDIVNVASPGTKLPDFLNLGFGLNYAGAYANFNFNNQNKGFSWKEMRNLRYDFFGSTSASPIAQAQLKNELNLKFATPEDLANHLNMPVDKLKAELNKQVAMVEAMAKKYAALLPAQMAKNLMQRVNEMKEKVDYFCNKLPTVSVPSMANLPIATFIPASDNFDLKTITSLIGTPKDKFNIADIGGYISGSKPLTLFMLVNFFNDFNESKANIEKLEAEIAKYEAERTTLEASINEIQNTPEYIAENNELTKLINEYKDLPKPQKGPGFIPKWSFIPGGPLADWLGGPYPYTEWKPMGTPKTEEMTKMNNCNAKIDEINAQVKKRDALKQAKMNRVKEIDDILNGTIGSVWSDGLKPQLKIAKGIQSGLEGALTQMGISQEMIDIIITIAPYFETAANVLNTINTTVTSIQDKNPWAYPLKASSKTPLNSVSVEAKFEYATSKFIYVTK